MVNLDETGSGFTSANMFQAKNVEIEFVQVSARSAKRCTLHR